ncbi:MAG: ATP-dependent DNA helicase [Burkholderiales bacterium]|nr:ATP-dependent DNA helicase [Burkholderiales bacterium]
MSDGLDAAVARAFAPDGPLAQHEPGFLPRPQQDRLAARIAQALQSREALVAEAGTGVGKTFAYLVPLLLSGRRALVSTATKSLQDQLFLRDLPRLARALKVPLRLALLKGRASYLCRHRLQQAQGDGQLPDRYAVRALQRVAIWAQGTRSGDLAEIEGLDDRSPVIPLVTSTRENCLGTECPEHRSCHVMQARREAMGADLVVVNHHLFFADLALRDSGVAELLPTVDAVVFDEAHQLVEAGVQFLGTVLSTGQALELGRDLLAQGLRHARGLQPWHERQAGLEQAARELRLAVAGPERAGGELRGTLKRAWPECADAWQPPLQALAAAATAAADARAALAETAPDFPRLEQRARALAALALRFAVPAAPAQVRWVDLTPHQARLVESPLDIREMLTQQRQAAPKAWVFTSATLGDDEALSWFSASTGLEDAARLRVGSPFDYPAHARVWVPARLPLPNADEHAAAVGALAARCALALQGRTFVLTTTLRVLPRVAQALAEAAAAQGRPLQVLVQGSEPRRALLQRYGDGRGSVLVGSQSFWEGIDMPGDALQCVLIDKLPFPPPNDPLVQARVRQLRAQGRDPFDDYFVAEAAVSLKQGAGRLIRTESDRGLLVLCDPRLRRMGYGRRLLAALPPMAMLDEEAQALAWLAELAAAH